ncbi:cyclophilin-like fold protein [uncultured Sphingobacterium sp.]|uniref:cyclophilin-like fold protein n=1 Tax=uncultured Sphingobacterium sp. TaxID=182688 RepID=UPI00374983A3
MKVITVAVTLLLNCLMSIGGNHKEEIPICFTPTNNRGNMDMRITVNGKVAKAVLYDNEASRDFAALLPMTLVLEDYNNTEKIVEISKKLSIDGAPSGFDPDIGDLTYYEPWGNLALFYKDFGYSNGLVSLGKVTEGLALFKNKGKLKVTFELD